MTYSLSKRREIREQMLREDTKGISVDAADKCKCPNCGQVHFKKRESTEKKES